MGGAMSQFRTSGRRRVPMSIYYYNKQVAIACTILLATTLGCSSVPEQRLTTSPVSPGQGDTTAAVNEINKALALSADTKNSALDYRIGPEDLIQVTIYNIPEQEARAT